MFTPVLIAGAGPVGLTLAAELARHGIESRIFDQNSGIQATSRAIAIHARTLEVFADMGLVEPILAHGHPIHGASIFAGGRRIVQVAFDELDSPYRYAIDLPRSCTEAILAEHLERYGGSVERRTTLGPSTSSNAGIIAHLRRYDGSSEEVEAEYLVGCDGAHSTVRETFAIPFEGTSSDEQFLLADVHIDWNQPDDEWIVWFHDTGVLAAFPLPGGLYRLVASAQSGLTSFGEVLRIWRERGPATALVHDPAWISSFRVTQKLASTYREGRVFLAGDAAHVHSPAGGQGMNTGIQDAYNLAWKLALVLKGESPESLLDSYTAERRPVAQGVLNLAGRMTTAATLHHPIPQSLRNGVMSTLSQYEVIQQRLVNRLEETSVTYRNSPIVAQQGRWYGAAPMPGDRAPHLDGPFNDTRFKVLLFTGDHPEDVVPDDFRTILRYMAQGYPNNVATYLITRTPCDWDGANIVDGSGQIHFRYGAGIPCVFILRPDNHVSFRAIGTHPGPILDHLQTLFLAEVD